MLVRNSIIWGNRVNTTVSSFFNCGSTITVSYSIVEGGYSGTGNLADDPLFVSEPGAASAPTSAGDYRLQATSPAIDAGDNSVVSATTDLAGRARRSDVSSVADTGSGSAPIVDMGAYERLPDVAVSSITRLAPAASPTSAASVQFQVVFAESVSAVEASDFAATVISGGLSGASITGVSGSSDTYVVTIDTGSGDGVLRLEPATAAEVVPLLVYPNPLNPRRYVVFNSGFTYREYDYLNNARQVPKLPDWAVLDLSQPPSSRFPGKVVAADFFDEEWKVRK
jgi:hypothetical protein